MQLSTIAVIVDGIWKYKIPLKYRLLAKAHISPITPPPSDIKTDFFEKLLFKSVLIKKNKDFSFFRLCGWR